MRFMQPPPHGPGQDMGPPLWARQGFSHLPPAFSHSQEGTGLAQALPSRSKGLQPREALPNPESSCPSSSQGSRQPGQQIQTPKLGGTTGKSCWRRAGSLLGQQQRRTGRARQENPEFSPPRCFACLTASRALPVGFQPLPAPGAPQAARSPGSSREVLQEPSLPQWLPGRCPRTGVCPPSSPQHVKGHIPAQSPQSYSTEIVFSSWNLFPMNAFSHKKPSAAPKHGLNPTLG